MSKKEEVEIFVGKKIRHIQAVAEYGSGKAMLAKLRRGVGHVPGELPELFDVILKDMPESLLSNDGVPTEGEWACYLALTLYALHQQGYDAGNQSMHTDEEVSIGHALSKLVGSYDDPNGKEDANREERCLLRLRMLTTSVDMRELSHHLRGVVQLLRSKGIPLNYRRLATDLYTLQFRDGRDRVCLRWGQDFYVK